MKRIEKLFWGLTVLLFASLLMAATGIQYFGTFHGDGNTLTNLPTGSIPIEQVGGVGGGVTDNTIVISNAGLSGKHFLFTNALGYAVSNTIFLTNNSTFEFTGSKLVYAAGYTNDFGSGLVVCATNLTNVHIIGMKIDGLQDKFQGGGDLFNGFNFAWDGNNGGTAAMNIALHVSGNRNGLVCPNSLKSSSLVNYEATGLSGVGVLFTGGLGSFPQPTNSTLTIDGVHGDNNWILCSTTNNAEYINIHNLGGANNGWLFWVASGNDRVTGGEATRNGGGVYVQGNAQNGAHLYFNDMTLNHTDVPILDLNNTNGVRFEGCAIYGAGAGGVSVVQITNSTGFSFTGCFGPTRVVVDGKSTAVGVNQAIGINVAAAPIISEVNGGEFNYEVWNTEGGANPWITNKWFNMLLNQNLTVNGTITGNGGGLTNLNLIGFPYPDNLQLFIHPTSGFIMSNATDIATWIDASGHGNNCPTGTGGGSGEVIRQGTGFNTCALFPEGGTFGSPGTFTIPSGVTWNATNSTIIIVCSPSSFSITGAAGLVTGNDANLSGILLYDALGTQLTQSAGGVTITTLCPESGIQLISMVNSSQGMWMRQDNQVYKGSAVASSSVSGGVIGQWSGAFQFHGRIYAVAILNTNLNSQQMDEVSRWADSTFSLQKKKVNLVCVGDSITAGLGTVYGLSVPDLIAEDKSLRVENLGISGTQATNWLSGNYTNMVAFNYNSNCLNVILYRLGFNDLSSGGWGSNAVLEFTRTNCQDYHAFGYQGVIVSTILPNTGTALAETNRINYNALLRIHWPEFADGLSDPCLDPIMGTYSANLLYFQTDGIHPTILGDEETFQWQDPPFNALVSKLQTINGAISKASNLVAPVQITFPATTVNWTNQTGIGIEIMIDNSGVTGTAIKKNGSQIFSSLTGDATFHLQVGETFSETYTIGTPVGKYSPSP